MAISWIIDACISNTIFLIFPTKMLRPTIESTDFWSRWLRWTYRHDLPFNAWPSMHVSSALIIGWLWWHNVSRVSLQVAGVIWMLAVMTSTVLVKQHSLLDIIGGIMVGLASIWLADRFLITVGHNVPAQH